MLGWVRLPSHISRMQGRPANERGARAAKRRLSGMKRKTGPGLALEALGVRPSERLAPGSTHLRTLLRAEHRSFDRRRWPAPASLSKRWFLAQGIRRLLFVREMTGCHLLPPRCLSQWSLRTAPLSREREYALKRKSETLSLESASGPAWEGANCPRCCKVRAGEASQWVCLVPVWGPLGQADSGLARWLQPRYLWPIRAAPSSKR